MIYLDNNASTKLDPEVREAMERAAGVFGNPSSIHAEGRRARRLVEESREEVAKLLGADADEIFFTSGGTEANAMAIFGGAAAGPPGGDRVLRRGAPLGSRGRGGDSRGSRRGLPRRPRSFRGPRRGECPRRGRRARLPRDRDGGQQRVRGSLPGGRDRAGAARAWNPLPHRRGAGGGRTPST